MNKRRSGILLHPTSLPGPYGIGDFGPEAYEFVDFLKASGQKLWQVLPLTIPDETGSPYASPSAFAGNWLLISPEILSAQGLLDEKDVPRARKVSGVNYDLVVQEKRRLIERSLEHFKKHASAKLRVEFKKFQASEARWLRDFTLFMAVKEHLHGRQWHRWPRSLADREPRTLKIWRKKLALLVEIRSYTQWLFFRQWFSLKVYANRKGIQIIGDLPFFVRFDSVDVWSHRNLFLLDKRNLPRYVSGVPPDYFSSRGQVWNDPQHNWAKLRHTGFQWWVERFRVSLRLFDIVRLDHFRGYAGVWHIRRGSLTARKGHWVPTYGQQLFALTRKIAKQMPFIAEDLGYITDDVVQLRKKFGFPGMRVLQFGFSRDPRNPHALKNLASNSVAYTGTHDNMPAHAWITQSKELAQRHRARVELRASSSNFAWKLIIAGLKSPARTFIIPMQDILNLGVEARMNTPSTKRKNWRWRQSSALSLETAKKLRRLTQKYRR